MKGILGLGAFAGVAVVAADRRRCAANPGPTGGAPLELPDGTEVAVRASDGGRLAVWVMDPPDPVGRAGPVVVCGHGWTADRRIWAATARRLLAGGRRVVVYDQRGHGASRAGHAGLTIEALGADVASVLEHLDLYEAVVAGHSMGGMAVQAFAIEHKDVVAERVAGLALVSTAGAEMSLKALDRGAANLVGSEVANRVLAHPTLGPLLVRGSFGRGASLVGLQATVESFVRASPATRKGFLQAIASMNLYPYLGSITVPTVVVSGTRDTMVPTGRSRRTGELIADARFVAIEGAGHQLPFEEPDRLAEILLDV